MWNYERKKVMIFTINLLAYKKKIVYIMVWSINLKCKYVIPNIEL